MNVGKKVTGKKVTEKKSQFWVGKKVTGKKVTKKNYAFSQLLVRNKHFYFYYYHYITLCFTGLGSSVGRVSAPRSGGTGFDPGPQHTKVVNNGTNCSPLGTRIFGVGLGLVAPVSV